VIAVSQFEVLRTTTFAVSKPSLFINDSIRVPGTVLLLEMRVLDDCFLGLRILSAGFRTSENLDRVC